MDEYYYKYKKYKAKYLNIRDVMFGGNFGGAPKRLVAEHFYEKNRWVPKDDVNVNVKILDGLGDPVNESEFNQMMSVTEVREMQPSEADIYLSFASMKMDENYLVDFVSNYLRVAINKPDFLKHEDIPFYNSLVEFFDKHNKDPAKRSAFESTRSKLQGFIATKPQKPTKPQRPTKPLPVPPVGPEKAPTVTVTKAEAPKKWTPAKLRHYPSPTHLKPPIQQYLSVTGGEQASEELRTDIETAATAEAAEKTFAEWLYLDNWVPWDETGLVPLRRESIMAELYTMYTGRRFKEYMKREHCTGQVTTICQKLEPGQALKYLKVANKKMDKEYLIKFLSTYIKLAEKEGPAAFNVFNVEADYNRPLAQMRQILKNLEQHGTDETIQPKA